MGDAINFSNLSKIHNKLIPKESIKISSKTFDYCKMPYPNHPKGCPNYDNNRLCPSNTELFTTDNFTHYYLIYLEFNFKKYKDLRAKTNPEFTKKQVSCVLYYQSSLKRLLKEYITDLYKTINEKVYLLGCGSGFADKKIRKSTSQDQIYSLEAVGINVFKTLKNNNIDFEIKPLNKILLCCLLCSNSVLKPIKRKYKKIDQF